MVFFLEGFNEFGEFLGLLIAPLAPGAVHFRRRPVENFFRGKFSGGELILSHFDDFLLLDTQHFLKFFNGLLKILIPDFQEPVFVLKLDFVLFNLDELFFPFADFLDDLLLQRVPGFIQAEFGLKVA